MEVKIRYFIPFVDETVFYKKFNCEVLSLLIYKYVFTLLTILYHHYVISNAVFFLNGRENIESIS